jgi:hypothetical protein
VDIEPLTWLRDALEALCDTYSWIVVCSAVQESLANADSMSGFDHGVLLAAVPGVTRRRALAAAIEGMRGWQTPPSGVVVTPAEPAADGETEEDPIENQPSSGGEFVSTAQIDE